MRVYLREIREKIGLSQQQVAEKLGISQNYYCMIETGDRQKKLDLEMAQKLADVFNVTLEFICRKENETK